MAITEDDLLTERAVKWLTDRGLDVEAAARLGWGASATRDGGEELVIPYFVGTDEVNHKFRRLDDKRFRQDAKATKCFWNYNAIVEPALADQALIVTEGEPDALAAIQCGYDRTVSVPDGAPAEQVNDPESRKYDYLEHARAALRDVREVILAVDGDGPGTALMNDLALRIGKAKCKWVQYPRRRDGSGRCKDLNETLLEYGEKGVHRVIAQAQWCKVDGLYRMSELPPYVARQGFETFPWLQRHYRIRMGDFAVVTGVPGDGKTTWVNDLVCRCATKHEWVIAIASFEQHPQADHRRFLREWYSERSEAEMSDDDRQRADGWIDRHFVFIVPDDDDLANLDWVLDKCASAVIRHGARIIVIDPWNELDHDRPADMSLTEYTGKAIKEFKRLARKLDVHVIVVAHPTKLQNSDAIPGLYSISDSAHWANKADVGIVIWKKDRESSQALCAVTKSRYHDQIGRPGKVWMEFNPYLRRFSESIEVPA